MANIIVSAFSNVTWTKQTYHDSFIEGFINSLRRCGNNLLSLRVNDFVIGGPNSTNKIFFDQAKFEIKIKEFQPDLIVVFNNTFPTEKILQVTNCPIACFASDSPAFFSQKNLIDKYLDRYQFFNFSNDTFKSIPEWFPLIKKDQLHMFGHATDLKAQKIEQDINISFVGSIGNYSHKLIDYFKFLEGRLRRDSSTLDPNKIKNDFYESLDEFIKDPLKSFEYYFYDGAIYKDSPIEPQIILMLTCKQRFQILSELTDLGLKIFGFPGSWSETIQYDYELFRCFDYNLSVSLDHSTYNYNRSKISLNLPHGHACEGFSWRVCDILASNAVLLSNPQPDLVKLMRGYVDLPMYQNKSEARELAIKLLKEKNWRKEISLASQKMIEDKCRFEKKFHEMQQIFSGIQLFTDKKGNLDSLSIDDCSNKILYKYKVCLNFAVQQIKYCLPYLVKPLKRILA
ncbi:MAG: hypothetical protein QNJ31_03560 [Candidatus Caenarcaniphilales bacterium]|nr:hypothetical protein [Candidatus Caenarcaniphilales bacterium]